MTENPWPVVELRQYTLHPGTRDVLIELFDRELVETQEAVGMRIIAQFRDENDPDRFVWLRAFHDMPSRGTALKAFYIDGAAWREHAPAVRATMVDTTNALLLQPATATSNFTLPTERPGAAATELPSSRVLATVYYPEGPLTEFTQFFETRLQPLLVETGATPIAYFQTDPTPNTFAALPVREETVFVWLALFEDSTALQAHFDALSHDRTWTEEVQPELSKLQSRQEDQLRLAPTARSLLR
ncbi:NIPSNAP family protein [Nocardia pseudovaccinii]|uniref:NIPSNAP family protein n=1 Tax=Nocardia pseudovaccinii TaxID=189540 RepID=UPI0007A3B6F3|nr:NIPSNAP family protein [Nocardia pseudovaccinii]